MFAAYATSQGRALVDRELLTAQVGYVLAVPKSQQIKSLAGIWRIDQLVGEASDEAWQRLSCGEGGKGPRVYDWAAASRLVFDPDPQRTTGECWPAAA